MTLPRFLTQPDPSFRGFTREQVQSLLLLRRISWGTADRYWGGVGVGVGGVQQVVPLTVQLVEPYAAGYWHRRSSEGFVLSPTGEIV
jgi:hypothetical protein